MIVKKLRIRTCRNKACSEKFTPARPMQAACSIGCAMILSKEKIQRDAVKAATADQKETHAKLLALKGLSYWEGRAQQAVNAYVRLRDQGQPCISCGITYSTVWQAGHYIAVGANSSHSMRYNPDNIHLQCVVCNHHKGGNAEGYQPRLVAKIGQERVDALRTWHAPVKATIEQCQAIEAEFKVKTKQLLKSQS